MVLKDRNIVQGRADVTSKISQKITVKETLQSCPNMCKGDADEQTLGLGEQG